jgi:hypothetical protein
MANKKNVQSMTPEELAAHVETVRQRNAANAKKYYETKIKTDPEKHNKFLYKCRAPNCKYYCLLLRRKKNFFFIFMM